MQKENDRGQKLGSTKRQEENEKEYTILLFLFLTDVKNNCIKS